MDFSQPVDSLVAWEGQFLIEKAGRLNALRFITKNVLSIIEEYGTTIDWLNHYMMLPLAKPLDVQAGDVVQVSFAYRCGGSIPSLEASIRTELVGRVQEEAVGEQLGAVVYA
jgi:hypothetical protein